MMGEDCRGHRRGAGLKRGSTRLRALTVRHSALEWRGQQAKGSEAAARCPPLSHAGSAGITQHEPVCRRRLQSHADLFPCGLHCRSVLRPEAGHATRGQERQEGKDPGFLLPGLTPGCLLHVSSSDAFTAEGLLRGLERDSGLASAFPPNSRDFACPIPCCPPVPRTVPGTCWHVLAQSSC